MFSKKGLTIEYVLLMMALVAVFIVVILLSVTVGTDKADKYREYLERKSFLDDIATSFISNKQGKTAIDLAQKYGDNDFGFQWTESGNDLVVRIGQVVHLIVSVANVGGEVQVVTYQYGLL